MAADRPASADFGPATVRHLLTHTAGVGFWRRRSDLLLHPGAGSGVTARTVVPLPEYYRGGLTVDVEPGTRWVYSNHGFTVLGQIVEDVSGESFGGANEHGRVLTADSVRTMFRPHFQPDPPGGRNGARLRAAHRARLRLHLQAAPARQMLP